MNIHRRLLVGVAATAITLTSATASPRHHDSPPAPDQKPMASMMMSTVGGMMNEDGMMMPVIGKVDHIEGRLAFLKTELKITDAQLTQWNAFADVVRTSASQMSDMMEQMSGMKSGATKPGLLDRIAMHEKGMTDHLEMLGRIKAALLPLYATFSDEQKTTADSLLCPMKM